MGKLQWSLLILYLTAAAGYGGWRGRDLWLSWGVWCLLVPPLVAGAFTLVGEWRRDPYWGIFKFHLGMVVVAVAALGGTVLGFAWLVAEATQQWSAQPAVRAVTGGALGAAGGGLALLYAKSRKATEPHQTSGSASTGGLAEQDAPADGRDTGS
jgi:hypothetical protein